MQSNKNTIYSNQMCLEVLVYAECLIHRVFKVPNAYAVLVYTLWVSVQHPRGVKDDIQV